MAAFCFAIMAAPAPATAMSVKEYFDLESATSIRTRRPSLGLAYLRGALEAYAYANDEALGRGQRRLYCDDATAPPHIDNIRAMLRYDAAELRRKLPAAEFDTLYWTTDITRFLLTSLQKHFPCP